MASKVQIIVATHKPYAMPNDKTYLPMHVGSKIAKKHFCNFTGDNTGKNISEKNPIFCELTGLYWAWKNLNADYIGLVHYRRYFKNPNGRKESGVFIATDVNDLETAAKAVQNLQKVVSGNTLKGILKTTDVILPKKRNYYIENLYDHYCKTMFSEPLIKTRKIIAKSCPEYLVEFDLLKQRRSMHAFNMFIMKKDLLNSYCEWLFPILFDLEKQIDVSKWNDFQKRYVGRISERLLDVWVNTNHVSYKELPIINIETVNWLKKGTGFLKAKFFGRQYEKSW